MFSPYAPPVPVSGWNEVVAMCPKGYLWIRDSWAGKAQWLVSDYTPVLDVDVPPEYKALLLLLD